MGFCFCGLVSLSRVGVDMGTSALTGLARQYVGNSKYLASNLRLKPPLKSEEFKALPGMTSYTIECAPVPFS